MISFKKFKIVKCNKDNIFLLSIFLFYFIYLSSFIGQGFNATDEGWLLQLGNRISQGEIPYKDFHYNRPPLTPYKQSFYINVINNYSIFFSRLIWGFELFLCIIIAFFIIKKNQKIDKIHYLLLISLIFFSTLIFYFPWYTYDAVLFALVSIFLLSAGNFKNKKYIFASGFFSFLSFLAKQNFIIISFSFIILILFVYLLKKNIKIDLKLNLSIIPYYVLGFLVGLIPYLSYLNYTKTFEQFFYHIFILPGECINLGFNFFLFQGNIPFLYLPLVGAFFLIIIINFNNKILNFLKYTFVFLFLPILYIISNKFTVVITTVLLLNLTVLSLQLCISCYYVIKNGKKILTDYYFIIIFFALILQYTSGLTYSGIIYSYIGSFISLPLTLIILYNNFFVKTKFSIFKISIPKNIILILVISLIISNIFIHLNFVYRDYPRYQLNYQFSNEKMRGIFSNENNVKRIDTLVSYIQNNTNKSDYIFVFPDFSVLYYLTERRNPTKIDWYTDAEITEKLALEAVKDIEKNKPKIILLQTYSESNYLREDKPINYLANNKYKIVYEYIINNFEKIDQIYDINIYRPKFDNL